jgi:hypothetical protein
MISHSAASINPIAKPIPCAHVADVEDHQEESGFFQAKCHLSATDNEFHPQAATSQRQMIQFTLQSWKRYKQQR